MRCCALANNELNLRVCCFATFLLPLPLFLSISLAPSLSLSLSSLAFRALQPDTNSHSLCIQRIRVSSTRLSLFSALDAHTQISNRSGSEVRARTCRDIAGRGKGHSSSSEEGWEKKEKTCGGRSARAGRMRSLLQLLIQLA